MKAELDAVPGGHTEKRGNELAAAPVRRFDISVEQAVPVYLTVPRRTEEP